MNQSLLHRGPDDEGYFQDSQASLAMLRLSIIDLHTGQQPISNETGDVWVVYIMPTVTNCALPPLKCAICDRPGYNGEIYNFQTVRAELQQRGHVFKTQTDTEINVHAYEEYGDDCVKHFNGMFGIALWDARQRRLLLARDRVGIKPPGLLSKDSIQKHGRLDHEVVTKWIHEHLAGRANHSHRLWALMVFEMWHRNERVPV